MYVMCTRACMHLEVRGHLEDWSPSSTLFEAGLFWFTAVHSGHLALELLGSSCLLPPSQRYSGITDAHTVHGDQTQGHIFASKLSSL